MKISDPKIELSRLKKPLLVVALGNPGRKYAKTRHNAGFIFADALASHLQADWEETRVPHLQLAKQGQLHIVKPLSFMNESGKPLRAYLDYFHLWPKDRQDLADSLLVIHDDLDLPFGSYRFSVDSRAAGHNGIKSIIQELGTKNFQRLRLGIMNPERKQMEGADFVLAPFAAQELADLKTLVEEIIAGCFVE